MRVCVSACVRDCFERDWATPDFRYQTWFEHCFGKAWATPDIDADTCTPKLIIDCFEKAWDTPVTLAAALRRLRNFGDGGSRGGATFSAMSRVLPGYKEASERGDEGLGAPEPQPRRSHAERTRLLGPGCL